MTGVASPVPCHLEACTFKVAFFSFKEGILSLFSKEQLEEFGLIYGGSWPSPYYPLGLRFIAIDGYARQAIILSDGTGKIYLCRDGKAYCRFTKGEFKDIPPIPLPVEGRKIVNNGRKLDSRLGHSTNYHLYSTIISCQKSKMIYNRHKMLDELLE